MKKKIATLLAFIWCFEFLSAQEIKNIQLKNEKILFPLKNYHIVLVKDDRSDTTNIGAIKTGSLSKKKTLLNLESGVINSLTRFIRNNVVQDTATSPLELHVSKFEVVETSSSGLKTENELTMVFTFYDGAQKLTENTGGGTTQSTSDPTKLIDELIRGNIETILHQFDDWWSKNQSFYTAQKTKPAIQVEVSMEDDSSDSDIISYSPKRPLTLDDFKGTPEEASNAIAITSSVVFMKYSTARNINNLIMVDVYVVANFDRSKSWCRKTGRTAETLEHEQRHFDISAIKACELVNAIKKFPFTVDNYQKELQRLQRQKQKELDEMQDQYDTESKRGPGPVGQEKWNKSIKDQLQNLTCFHS